MTQKRNTRTLEEVTIRFAGDSGDGMQLTGTQFTHTTALFGNDLSTLPDFPAEIRAPQGTLYGVSSFQLHFGTTPIHTAGDMCDVLVAMNAAALKVNLNSLANGGLIIANTSGFTSKNLRLAHYDSNPLEDGSLKNYTLFTVDIAKMTGEALRELNMSTKEVERCKNFFALGLLYWLYNRPLEPTIRWTESKFARSPELAAANLKALHAGWNFGETAELFHTRFEVSPAKLAPGTYRNITGNMALAYGLIAAARKSGLELFFGSYPITPASDILHYLSTAKNFGVKTFQAEDEIASVASAIGASFGGALGATSTSGPGLALKAEAIGLAIMTELPLLIIDVQRAGPSTGMPTKVEQADLFQALYGRNGEAPAAVLAPATPGDCFPVTFEAARLALQYRVPVFILSDANLANGSEPWRIPDADTLPAIDPQFAHEPENFQPYARDEHTLARPWAIPGTPGLEHRIGGLEKQHESGTVSYDPQNHEKMVKLRAEKILRMAETIPPAQVEGPPAGELLIVAWGSTYGAIRQARENLRERGIEIAHLHLRYLNPMQSNVGEILYRYKQVLVPELNDGQLLHLIRSRYMIPALRLNKIQGLPFKAGEIEHTVLELISDTARLRERTTQ